VGRHVDDARDLVEQVLDGNADAFRSLIERNQRLVSHIVFKMVANEADREDLCQEVFMKVYNSIGRFEFRCKISTWIAKVAYNTCSTYLERRRMPLFEDLAPESRTIECCVDDNPLPDRHAEEADVYERLHKEIERLPSQYRTIIALYHLDEMSYAEIGEIMSLPPGTVKSYLFRARKMLKDRLMKKYNPEELWNRGT
jgi:RNA polymerase sigma-70 factor (ECF subfamily)